MALPPDAERGASVHALACVETASLGSGTSVGAFTRIFAGAVIGRDCAISDQVIIRGDVVIGDRAIVHSGVQMWDGVTLENDVLVGPNATFPDASFPGSRRSSGPLKTVVKANACIGANATVLPGLVVGRGAVVGAGATVTRSVPANAVVVGTPARIVRYAAGPAPRTAWIETEKAGEVVTGPSGVFLRRSRVMRDLRGSLVAREDDDIPFIPRRSFLVFDVAGKEARGEHAHRTCHQFLVAVRGSMNVLCDDASSQREYVLDSPDMGLYMPPMIWGTQYKYSEDAVLLVFASHRYDANDYIRDYETFLAEKRRSQGAG